MSLNNISKNTLLIVLCTILFILTEKYYSHINKKTYNYLELKHQYKNYKIVEKDVINDTCYYLILKNTVDSTRHTKTVKVKDYIFFNWYVGDCIK